jgi:hypothetical protein
MYACEQKSAVVGKELPGAVDENFFLKDRAVLTWSNTNYLDVG